MSRPHHQTYVSFRWLLVGLLGSALGVAAHGEEAEPAMDWEVKSPATAGFDPAALAQLTKDIAAGEFPNTHAVLVEHAGSLVYEEYFTGTDERMGRPLGKRLLTREGLHDLRSMSKSVTAALLGIALEKDLDQVVRRPIAEYLPQYRLEAPHQRITLHHVLTMTTGLQWNEMSLPYTDSRNDSISLYGRPDPVQYVLSRPLAHEPGSTWYYNGGCTQVLADVILRRTGMTVDKFAERKLFEPLGIRNYEWLGPYRQKWTSGNPSAMAGLRLTACDLAKIGSVYAHEGQWRERQIVPKAWVELSSQRYVKEMGAWSGGGVWGYGYHWKVGDLPTGERALAAAGNGNQRCFVIPQERVVVSIYAGQYYLPFKPHSEKILARVLAARK